MAKTLLFPTKTLSAPALFLSQIRLYQLFPPDGEML